MEKSRALTTKAAVRALLLFIFLLGSKCSWALAAPMSARILPGEAAIRAKQPNSPQKKHQRAAPITASSSSSFSSSSSSSLKRLLTGGTSRALAQMILYPVDALRTLAQTRDGRTLADVGLASLVRGSTTTSLFAFGMGSLQFGVFGYCREQLHWPALWASAFGAAGSCIVSVPQEVIKQRLVTKIYPTFSVAVKSIAQQEGLGGFYSAWKPTMARNVPFVMTTFTLKDILESKLIQRKRQLLRRPNESSTTDNKSSLSTLEMIAVGVASAFCAGAVTMPMDVVKTRLMTQAASQHVPYTSALDCFVTIVRTEGVTALYSGFQQRSVYMCSLWGVTFALNGIFQKRLGLTSSAAATLTTTSPGTYPETSLRTTNKNEENGCVP